mmetsp:Transcript_92642/g.299664  ORF Transcript_92642/g.299664 Transcript_92642/m.299664 type:complete len:242 (+) Transcript_92642:239-964(+)
MRHNCTQTDASAKPMCRGSQPATYAWLIYVLNHMGYAGSKSISVLLPEHAQNKASHTASSNPVVADVVRDLLHALPRQTSLLQVRRPVHRHAFGVKIARQHRREVAATLAAWSPRGLSAGGEDLDEHVVAGPHRAGNDGQPSPRIAEHPVYGSLPTPIRPPGQQCADIEDDGSLYKWNVDPSVVDVHLQATRTCWIKAEHGQPKAVHVGTVTHLPVKDVRRRHIRVVCQPKALLATEAGRP